MTVPYLPLTISGLKHTPLHMNPTMDCHTHIAQELYKMSHTHVPHARTLI